MKSDRSPFLTHLTRRNLLKGAGHLAVGLSVGSALAASSVGNATQPKRGGVARFAYSDGTPHDILDTRKHGNSAISVPITMIYDGLLIADNGYSPRPGIATSWETSGDAKTWTFHIRKGVEFHDGTKLTAKDVAYSIRMQVDPNGPAVMAGTVGKLLTPDNVKVLDDFTVRCTLLKPNAFLYAGLQSVFFRIVKDGRTDFTTSHVGTGPFIFEEFIPGQVFRAKRNPNYWQEGLPYLDEVVQTIVPEPATQYQALISNQLDLIDTIDYALAKNLQSSATHEPLLLEDAIWMQVIMDGRRNPIFNNQNLVKAIKLATDRQQVIDTVFGGLASIGYDHAIPKSDPFFNSSLKEPKRDTAAAKSALRDAGYANGIDLGELVVAPILGSTVTLAQVLQQQLAEVNIRFTIKESPAATFWDDVWLKKPFYISYNNRRHASEAWSLFYLGPWAETGLNSIEFKNAALDAEATTDIQRQKELFGLCQQIAAAQDTRLMPAYASRLFGISKKLRGVRPNFVTYSDFTGAYFTE